MSDKYDYERLGELLQYMQNLQIQLHKVPLKEQEEIDLEELTSFYMSY